MVSPLYLLWSKVIWWVFWLCKAHPHGQNHFSIFHSFMLTGTVIVVFLSYLVWAITLLRPLAMCLHHFQGSLSEAVPTAINFYLNLCFMHLGPLKVESCLCFSGYYSTMKFLGSIAPFLQHVSSWVILWFNRSYWWSGQVGEWGGQGMSGHMFFCMKEISAWFQVKRRGPTLSWENWAISAGLESFQKSGFWAHQHRCLHPMCQVGPQLSLLSCWGDKNHFIHYQEAPRLLYLAFNCQFIHLSFLFSLSRMPMNGNRQLFPLFLCYFPPISLHTQIIYSWIFVHYL